ncbi:MAG: hypothetical protein IIX61_10470 [Loktanella sp.]|nr:hypothetical protein [Loktanella sp.]
MIITALMAFTRDRKAERRQVAPVGCSSGAGAVAVGNQNFLRIIRMVTKKDSSDEGGFDLLSMP